jgi:hypothetical protein
MPMAQIFHASIMLFYIYALDLHTNLYNESPSVLSYEIKGRGKTDARAGAQCCGRSHWAVVTDGE